MNFVILGAGAWGTAMAVHLARLDRRVTLVPRRMEQALAIASTRENTDYLPGVPLVHDIQLGCEIAPSIMEADVLLLACPSVGLRELCRQIVPALAHATVLRHVICLAKGLEQGSLLLPQQVLEQELGDCLVGGQKLRFGVLSGPSFAVEVAAGKPTAVVLAAVQVDAELTALQEAMSDRHLRVYCSDDVTGVELGGCLKNIYAIGAGISEGLELGHNATGAYLTRALREMVCLGTALGGRAETFYGLSGFGDLITTCTGPISRNRTFGVELSRGKTAEQLLSGRKNVVEGYWATECFYKLCAEKNLEAPILSQIYRVLYENKPAKEAIAELMLRDLKASEK